MIVQVIIGNSHTCLVFTTHMEVVEISVNFHTYVVFTKQPEWDPSLNNFHSKLLSYFEQFPFLSILISFIFEFFGSLCTKTLLLRKFCFWYGNTILFYILSFNVRFQENSKNDNFEFQQVFIQTLSYQKYPQIACQRGCKVALIAFVWLFSTVSLQMFPQIACPRGSIFTLVAFGSRPTYVSSLGYFCNDHYPSLP